MLNKGMCVGAAVVALLGTSPGTVEAGCFGSLGYCFRQTTVVYGFWDRFFAALDCELDFTECVRIRVLGL